MVGWYWYSFSEWFPLLFFFLSPGLPYVSLKFDLYVWMHKYRSELTFGKIRKELIQLKWSWELKRRKSFRIQSFSKLSSFFYAQLQFIFCLFSPFFLFNNAKMLCMRWISFSTNHLVHSLLWFSFWDRCEHWTRKLSDFCFLYISPETQPLDVSRRERVKKGLSCLSSFFCIESMLDLLHGKKSHPDPWKRTEGDARTHSCIGAVKEREI